MAAPPECIGAAVVEITEEAAKKHDGVSADKPSTQARLDASRGVHRAAAAAGASRCGHACARQLLMRRCVQLSESDLAALGYVKASSVPRGGGALEFSGGLLPESAQADTYEDKSKVRPATAQRAVPPRVWQTALSPRARPASAAAAEPSCACACACGSKCTSSSAACAFRPACFTSKAAVCNWVWT